MIGLRSTSGALLLIIVIANAADKDLTDEEHNAEIFMNALDIEIAQQRNILLEAMWTYGSNITDHNEQLKNDAAALSAVFTKETVQRMSSYNYSSYKSDDLRRRFRRLSKADKAVLSETKYREYIEAVSAMESNYGKVRVCDYHNATKCDLQLEPEITHVLIKSRDPEELKYYWQQWYDKAGTPMRSHFDTYVRLVNEAAVLNNFTSYAEAWLSEYEDDSFEQQLIEIFEQVRPLYEQLHGYVRARLLQLYGPDVVCRDGPIPMHLLGNMWGQSWENIVGVTTPYPDKPKLDVTEEMIRQNYTAVKMFQMGDEFFQSINMTKLPQEFWNKSILEKPGDGRDLVCHASAWDFFVQNDVRIKQCTRISMGQLLVVHHELGHIQYYLQYQHQPSVYREGPNPGFHEAIGDTISFSVETPKHLQKIGLLKEYVEDEQNKINMLYGSALKKVIMLPFTYTIEKYRWSIFRGQIPADQQNREFWRLREEYSGIVPPLTRTDADFDPPAKYHMTRDVEYLRYLVALIVQFQFHKALCLKADEYEAGNPMKALSNCDIYQSAEAGNALKALLSLGSSKPWPDALEALTGSRKIDTSAMLEYFQPLYDWLLTENQKLATPIGWKDRSC